MNHDAEKLWAKKKAATPDKQVAKALRPTVLPSLPRLEARGSEVMPINPDKRFAKVMRPTGLPILLRSEARGSEAAPTNLAVLGMADNYLEPNEEDAEAFTGNQPSATSDQRRAPAAGCRARQRRQPAHDPGHRALRPRSTTMSTVMQLPMIAGVEITTDAEGRFNLNAPHRASGTPESKKPSEWLRAQQAKDLILELETQSGNSRFAPISSVRGGNAPGTFAAEQLAVAYANWISPAFFL